MNKHSLSLFTLFLCFSFLGLQSCKKDSSEVDADRIKTEYFFTYNQNTNKTVAKVEFSTSMFKGRTVKLNEGAQILFNGTSMDYRSGGVYSREFTGVLDSGTFVYKDNTDRTFQNVLHSVKYIDFPSYFNALTLGQHMDIVWTGDVIDQSTFVELVVTNKSSSSKTVTFTAQNFGGNSIFIDGNRLLEKLEPGEAKATLRRYRLENLQQGTIEGGSRKAAYEVTRDIIIY